jgi:hypothetical protein
LIAPVKYIAAVIAMLCASASCAEVGASARPLPFSKSNTAEKAKTSVKAALADNIPEKVRSAFNASAVRIDVYEEIVASGGKKKLMPMTHGNGFVVRKDEKTWVATALHVVSSYWCPPPCYGYVFQKDYRYIVYDGKQQFLAKPVGYRLEDDTAILEIEGPGFGKVPIDISSQEFEKGSGPFYAAYFAPSGAVKITEFSDLDRYSGEFEFNSPLRLRKVGILPGLAWFGYSGGCIIDREGICHGMLQGMIPFGPRQVTLFIPSLFVMDFVEATKDRTHALLRNERR